MARTPLLPHGSVASTLEPSTYSEYASSSSRFAPRPVTTLKHALKSNIQWAELQFPPINLWVMASLAYEQGASQRETAHIHQRQRLGSTAVDGQIKRRKPNALHKLHRRLESLLAVRGGKV